MKIKFFCLILILVFFSTNIYSKINTNKIKAIIEKDQFDKVIQELDKIKDINELIDPDESTIIFFLSKYCYLSDRMLSYLLTRGINLNQQNKYGESVLMQACKYNDVKTARLLIENGIDINIENKMGNTALYYTISSDFFSLQNIDFIPKYEYEEILLKALTDKNDINLLNSYYIQDKSGKYKLKNKSDKLRSSEILNLKLFFIRIDELLSLEICKILVHKKIDINKTNILKISPLMYSLYFSKNSVSKLLISKGADCNYKYDYETIDANQTSDFEFFEEYENKQLFIPRVFAFKNATPLFIAYYMCNKDMEELLKSKNSNIFIESLVINGIHSGQEYARNWGSKVIHHIKSDFEIYPLYDLVIKKSNSGNKQGNNYSIKRKFLGIKINVPYNFSIDNIDNDKKVQKVIVSEERPVGYLQIDLPTDIELRFLKPLKLFQENIKKVPDGEIEIMKVPYYVETITGTKYGFFKDNFFIDYPVSCSLAFYFVPSKLTGESKYFDYNDKIFQNRDSAWLAFHYQIYYNDFIPEITFFYIDLNSVKKIEEYVYRLVKESKNK